MAARSRRRRAPGHSYGGAATTWSSSRGDLNPPNPSPRPAGHFMPAFDRWKERGFEAIARDYLERLPKRKAGERRGIDVNGDLLVSQPAGSGAPERSSLKDALGRAAWYDPQARGPKFG